MATPRGTVTSKAYAGRPPTSIPQLNACDFLFSDPFEHSNDSHAPASQRVDCVADDTAIYVDNATGKRCEIGGLRRSG